MFIKYICNFPNEFAILSVVLKEKTKVLYLTRHNFEKCRFKTLVLMTQQLLITQHVMRWKNNQKLNFQCNASVFSRN